MDSKTVLNTKELKRLRKLQGLSQEGLAYACEQRCLRASIATIKRAESGKAVSFRTAHELATFFDVGIEVLVSGSSAHAEVAEKLPESYKAESPGNLAILWIRLEDWDGIVDVVNFLRRRACVWLEQLGNTVIAAFGNFGSGRRGHIHAQMTALEIGKFLKMREKRPARFYAAIQMGAVHQHLDHSEVSPVILQWFAQYSMAIPANKIIVSDEVCQISSHHFRYVEYDQGSIKLCLLEEAVCAGQMMPMVGRSAELLQISAILDSVIHRTLPAVVHITGPSGIGKSRLLSSVHEQARLREMLIADVDLESGWQDSIQILTTCLCRRLYGQVRERSSENQLRNLLDDAEYSIEQKYLLYDLLGIDKALLEDHLPPPDSGPPSETQLLKGIASFFSSLLEQQASSLLITIDNIHLSGEAGYRLLSGLIVHTRDLPLSYIVTSRIESDVSAVLQNLPGEGCNLSTITLGPLSAQDVEKICSTFDNLDEEYKQHCTRLAEGVPLYLVQLLSKKPESGEMPPSLKWVVEEKLAQLQHDDRLVVELLSVCDAPLPLTSLEELLEREGYSVANLVRYQLVKFDSNQYIKLCHQLVRHIVYQQLSEEARRIYHRILADYLEKNFNHLQGVPYSSVARHYEVAGLHPKAADFYYLSAAKLLHKGLYDSALEHLNSALRLHDSEVRAGDSDLEINIQLALSSIYKVKYGWVSPLLKSSYQRVVTLCENRKEDRRLSLALFGLWTIELATLNLENAERLANRCLEVARNLDDSQGSMHAYTALCNTLFWLGKHRRAESSARMALSLYQPAYSASSIQLLGQDPRSLAGAFGACSASLLGDTERAETYRREILDAEHELKHDFSLAIAIQGSAWLEYHLREPKQVLLYADKLEALSIEMGFPFYRGVASLFLGWARHELYRIPEAAQSVVDGYYQWLATSGDKIAYSLFCTILSEIYVDSGRLDDARTLLEGGIAFAIEHSEYCYLPEMYRFLSFCLNGEARESCVREGLRYTAESPVFEARLHRLLEPFCL